MNVWYVLKYSAKIPLIGKNMVKAFVLYNSEVPNLFN